MRPSSARPPADGLRYPLVRRYASHRTIELTSLDLMLLGNNSRWSYRDTEGRQEIRPTRESLSFPEER